MKPNYFDRHENMTKETRVNLLSLITDFSIYSHDINFLDLRAMNLDIKNALYGLFDGFYYKEKLNKAITAFEERGLTTFATRLNDILDKVNQYPEKEMHPQLAKLFVNKNCSKVALKNLRKKYPKFWFSIAKTI